MNLITIFLSVMSIVCVRNSSSRGDIFLFLKKTNRTIYLSGSGGRSVRAVKINGVRTTKGMSKRVDAEDYIVGIPKCEDVKVAQIVYRNELNGCIGVKDPVSSKEPVDVVNSKDSIDVVSSKDVVDVISSKEPVDDVIRSKDVVSSKDVISSKDVVDVISNKEPVDVVNNKDVISSKEPEGDIDLIDLRSSSSDIPDSDRERYEQLKRQLREEFTLNIEGLEDILLEFGTPNSNNMPKLSTKPKPDYYKTAWVTDSEGEESGDGKYSFDDTLY